MPSVDNTGSITMPGNVLFFQGQWNIMAYYSLTNNTFDDSIRVVLMVFFQHPPPRMLWLPGNNTKIASDRRRSETWDSYPEPSSSGQPLNDDSLTTRCWRPSWSRPHWSHGWTCVVDLPTCGLRVHFYISKLIEKQNLAGLVRSSRYREKNHHQHDNQMYNDLKRSTSPALTLP